FQGEFFKLTLMTPFFSPEPHEYHRIPIFVAGVNRRMCQLAGDLCEGFHAHPLHSARYLKERVLPNIEIGLMQSGRQRHAIEISSSIFVIPSDNPAEAAKYESEIREQISFYASTPPYRPVFELEGWGDVADELKALAARARWPEMPALITDEMLDRFALRGTWSELPEKVLKKYDGLLDRVRYYFPLVPDENKAEWHATVAGFKRSLLFVIHRLSPIQFIDKAGFPHFLDQARVDHTGRFHVARVRVTERIEGILYSARLRNRIFAHAETQTSINFFGDGWVFDSFFLEDGVDQFGFCFKCVNPLDVGHDDTARDVALIANQRSRHSHAAAGKIKGQLGEIGQRTATAAGQHLVQTLGTHQRTVDVAGDQRGHAGRRVA